MRVQQPYSVRRWVRSAASAAAGSPWSDSCDSTGSYSSWNVSGGANRCAATPTTRIAAAKQLSAAWWRAADNPLVSDSSADEWRAHFAEAHNAWVEFSTAAAAVTVAGPRAAADAANDLRRAMSAWETVGMDWVQQSIRSGVGGLDDFASRFKIAAEVKRAPDKAFQEAARRALDTDN